MKQFTPKTLDSFNGTKINYKILGVKAFKVDGKKIKEDVFYVLEKGKAKEV